MKKLITFLTLSSVMCWQLTHAQNIVISEIMYNPPSVTTDTLEYIELYNNSASAVNLLGYKFTSGIVDTLPSYTLAPDTFVVVAKYAAQFQQYLGGTPLQWFSGSLNNAGEAIVLRDPAGVVVDSVYYMPTLPWDTLADGHGYSLVLCDPNADNSLPESWTHKHQYIGFYVDSLFGNPWHSCVIPDTSHIDTTHTGIANRHSTIEHLQIINGAARVTNLSGNYDLDVFDVLGNMVSDIKLSSDGTYSFKSLQNGMYFARLRNRQTLQTETAKLIVNTR